MSNKLNGIDVAALQQLAQGVQDDVAKRRWGSPSTAWRSKPTALDLRGFLGLDESVKPGYDEVSYVVRLRTDASAERVEELHKVVTKTSVNLANFSKAIRMVPKLEVLTA